jgi:hypothetical protein
MKNEFLDAGCEKNIPFNRFSPPAIQFSAKKV